MDAALLCSSGSSTTIWSVDSDVKVFRELRIASQSCRAIDWNQNNNYVFLCSSDGDMYLQNVKKETLISAQNIVSEDRAIPIISGLILTGSRFVICSDVAGNIRLWPIAKTGFSSPVMDVNYPGCHITCFTEYSASLLYACTSHGDVIEVNHRNYQSEVIVTIENESITSIINVNNTLFLSTASGSIYRLLPLIKRYTRVYSDSNMPLQLSFSMSTPLNSVLCYSGNILKVFNLKTYHISGILQTSAMITAADIFNDRIVVATADQTLSLWSVYNLSVPLASVSLNHRITTLRFSRLLNSSSHQHSALNTPQKTREINESHVNPVSSITSTPTQMGKGEQEEQTNRTEEDTERFSHYEQVEQMEHYDHMGQIGQIGQMEEVDLPEQNETRINSSIEMRRNALLEKVESQELRGILMEIMQPMITELQTFVHREVSELKADMIRQFSDQEQIIQEQYEQIEQLLQMLQQKR